MKKQGGAATNKSSHRKIKTQLVCFMLCNVPINVFVFAFLTISILRKHYPFTKLSNLVGVKEKRTEFLRNRQRCFPFAKTDQLCFNLSMRGFISAPNISFTKVRRRKSQKDTRKSIFLQPAILGGAQAKTEVDFLYYWSMVFSLFSVRLSL